MKSLRYISSVPVTAGLAAVLAGIYVFQTFGNEDPWLVMTTLLKESPVVMTIVVLLLVQLLSRGLLLIIRGGRAAAPSALVAIALALIAGGMFLSVHARASFSGLYAVNDVPAPGLRLANVELELPETILVIGDEGDMSVRNPRAYLDDQGSVRILRAFPFTLTSAGFGYINDAGITPGLNISVGGEETPASPLRLLPPGKRGKIRLMNDYSVEITLAPAREYQKGRLTAKEYRIKKPAYRVVIRKGGEVINDGTLEEGGRVTAEEVGLAFGETIRWVELIFVKDPAFFILLAGWGALVLGVISYPFIWFLRRT